MTQVKRSSRTDKGHLPTSKITKTDDMRHCLTTLFFFLAALTLSAQRTVKVACVGNSVTYGTGIEKRETEAYPVQLQNMLGKQYEVRNFGKPGATLLDKGHRPYKKQEEFAGAVQFAADIVVIHLGLNDTDPRNWPNYRDDFVGDYTTLIDTFRAVNPKARIIIALNSPIAHRHPRFLSGTRDWFDEIQTAIRQVAEHNKVQLINFHQPLYPYPFMLPDGLHPDGRGAKRLAQTVYSAITGNYGGLQMAAVYSDNMVLPRDRAFSIGGKADADEQVTVSIGKLKVKTKADGNGDWAVELSGLKVGAPYTLDIATKQRRLTFRNILAGEVFLCSGQSNMEFALQTSTTGGQEVSQARDSLFRLYDMKARWSTAATEWSAEALDSVNMLAYFSPASWQLCTPQTAARYSAVAYYFGKMLRDSLKVPVGLICNAVGGATTESWIDRSTLEHHFPAILYDWTKNDFIQDWARKRALQNIKQGTEKFQRHPFEPTYLYDAGIRPIERFPIDGVIWYQGESNAHNSDAHAQLFRLLTQSWRQAFGNAQLPFYFVQLSGIDRPSWSWFRHSQGKLAASVPHTYMAVSYDHGDSLDVHPRHKQPVGERLARLALHYGYGQKHVTPSGATLRLADFRHDDVILTFDHADGLHTADGAAVRGFEIAEPEGFFFPAQVEVSSNKLRLWSPNVKRPCLVRYAWAPFTRANLINAAGLPTPTFRVER